MNAIYILWLRELKRYTRSKAQIFASFGQPLLYLLVLGFGLGPVFERAGSGSYLQFVAPGVIGMTVLYSSIFSGIGLLWDRQFGFLKETLVAPVPRVTVMIGKALGGATVAHGDFSGDQQCIRMAGRLGQDLACRSFGILQSPLRQPGARPQQQARNLRLAGVFRRAAPMNGPSPRSPGHGDCDEHHDGSSLQ